MKCCSNLNSIIDILSKYLINDKKITYKIQSQLIKISIDVSVVFIILDKDDNIKSIEMCIQNCLIKKYFNNKDLLNINSELQEYAGKPI